ncbi:MAG: hypothetical protein HWE15_14150 [Algoriphagus sp.]|uniref:DUF6090 family protein n=1 Tax=Algoriphagus sp. TaxID=1872435 RepID=UPI0017F8F42E|nr:DUF6090 family protein [Algoriphagus sp.]NVJ87447.1 hypothetical protein [Algoriphagus sp.]
MIKFFRKIRQHFLSEGKTGKYLKYAIGEIILVVIGILIAVAINDAYNNAKNEAKIKVILTQIQDDIIADLNDSERILRVYIRKDSTARNILNDRASIKNTWWELRPFDGYVNFSVHREGYKRLMNNLENLPEKYNGLLSKLNDMYVVTQEDIAIANENLLARSDNSPFDRIYTNPEHAKHVMNNFTTDEAKRYILEDPFLKNRTIDYMQAYRNVVFTSNRFRVTATELYKQIDSLLAVTDSTLPESLEIHQSRTTVEPYLGDYTHFGGNELIPSVSALHFENNLMYFAFRGKQYLYWLEDNYFFTERGQLFRIYKNEEGQQFVEISDGIRSEILIKN